MERLVRRGFKSVALLHVSSGFISSGFLETIVIVHNNEKSRWTIDSTFIICNLILPLYIFFIRSISFLFFALLVFFLLERKICFIDCPLVVDEWLIFISLIKHCVYRREPRWTFECHRDILMVLLVRP